MATIGQALTQPEAGWRRYNETHPAFNYTGTWTSYSSSGYYGGSSRYTNTIGNSVKFKFVGSKLRILAEKHASRSASIAVTIDGQSYSYSQQGAAAFQILLFEMNELVVGVHEVEIKNTDGMYIDLDSIDIDSDGRLLHPDEVISVNSLEIGKRIRCHYKALPNILGTFSNIGQETSNFIPTASSATPDGDFYFIMVEDWNGQKRLIADRNIQHSISWDTLNNEGVISNGIPFGRVNSNQLVQSLNFNGINSYAGVNYASVLKPTSEITIEMTLYKDGWKASGISQTILSTTQVGGYGMWINAAGEFRVQYHANGAYRQFGADVKFLTDGEFHKLTSTYDGQIIRLYADGVLLSENDFGIKYPIGYSYNNAVAFGMEQGSQAVPTPDNNPNYFKGCINDVAIWGKALTAEQVALYQTELIGNEPNLLGYWLFTESVGNSCRDRTSNKNTATLTNTSMRMLNKEYSIRLLTGGVSSTDTDNEWDKYIVNSTLNNTITAGDNAVWNWNNATSSWVSSTEKTPNKRVLRGGAQGAQYFTGDNNTLSVTSSASSFNGFRPMLLIDSKIINRAFVQVDGEYRKWNGSEWLTISETMPSVDTFINDGMKNISVLDRRQKVSLIPMIDSGVSGEPLGNGKMFKGRINLNKLIEVTSIEVKPNM